MTSDERVAAIRARTDAATKGPWQALGTGVRGGDHWYVTAAGESIASIHANDGSDEDTRESDAEFIAASRDDITFLLDEREQLFGRVSQLETVIDAVREWHLQWRRDTRRSMADAELLKVLERAGDLSAAALWVREKQAEALEEAAKSVDSLAHNWSGTVATALFHDADSLRARAAELRNPEKEQNHG